MTTKQRSTVELHFADGSVISSFISFSLRETFSDPLGSLNVDIAPPREEIQKYKSLLQKGELLTVLVDGKTQAGMMIETCTIDISPQDGVTFRVDAVTPLKVMYEGSVDDGASKSLQADAPVLDLVSEVVGKFGIGEVSAGADIAVVKAKTGTSPSGSSTAIGKLKFKELQVQKGETAYTFLSRVLTRLGVMLRMDAGLGALYITAPHLDGRVLYTCIQGPEDTTANGDRFFGGIKIVDTNSGQHSFCEVEGVAADDAGETTAGTPRGKVLSSDLNASRPPFRSTSAINYKPRFGRDPSARDIQRATSVARLVLGLAAEKAFVITGSVHGLVSIDGIPWTVDTLGRVQLTTIGHDETMWLAERTMHVDAHNSQWTDLTWIPPGNFTIGESPTGAG